MPVKQDVYFMQATPGTTSGTTITTQVVRGLRKYDWFTVDAVLKGNTGGTLDVYLQRQVKHDDGSVWLDWVHFPQQAAAAAKKAYTATAMASNGAVVVGTGSDAGVSLALAANTVVGGHPGDVVRMVLKSGASTSAATPQTVWITGWQGRD
jgi:hypothetical protein